MIRFFATFLAAPLLLLAGCATTGRVNDAGVPIDQLAMYGGMDRSAHPDLKAGDDAFIASAGTAFGGKGAASIAWVNRGFVLYRQDNLAGAMQRFNQAWLLNPDFPEVYWGFASVLNDQRKFCQAVTMNELAVSKGPIQDGFLPDAAVTYASCAAIDPTVEPSKKSDYLRRSEELFIQAYTKDTVSKDYVLRQWAIALFRRGEYALAWLKAHEYRRLTGNDLPDRFLKLLREKMTEPSAQ